MSKPAVRVIGGGLAGCEAAWLLAGRGFPVTLVEMKPRKKSPAHQADTLAELVCSNSLKASRLASAGGLLKAEMRLLGSLLLEVADTCAVPAGGALAVDRVLFSQGVTAKIRAHPGIRLVEEEAVALPQGPAVVATGPLTSPPLADAMAKALGTDYLSFFDAASPIVTADSVDRSVVFAAARYGRGGEDYLNCPMNQGEYDRFYDALLGAERAEQKAFEREELRVYEGCMPVEVLAARGRDSLRYGPLKPVGLDDPHTGRRPWAVVQLRQEDAAASLYNLVGFQTNLKFPEQKRVFSLIPGLGGAEFVRYGVMHRNTFLDSPRLLDQTFALAENPLLCFAGQLTGVEGYMESAASGLIAALQLSRRLEGRPLAEFPATTLLGALCRHVAGAGTGRGDFQPMGANMGLLPPLDRHIRDKQARYQALAERSLADLQAALD